MLATAAFILPSDVMVVPVAGLAPEFARLGRASADDVAVTRPRGRAPSCIVDKRFATFIVEFRSPKTFAAAIVDYARRNNIDSGALLDAVLPLLARFVDAGFLVPADAHAREVRDPLRVGDAIGPFRVTAVVSTMNDTEVYAVAYPAGDIAALKIAPQTPAPAAASSLEREAAVLKRLDGRFNPRLRATGVADGRPYLLMDWCAGEPVVVAAERVRSSAGLAGARALAVGVLEAFAHLHAQGVIHGDVQPANVLCARGATISIVDYGFAVADSLPQPAEPRGGVGFFFEPELISSRGAAGATARGEQYALSALVFYLLTGEMYLDFSLAQETALEQIVTQPPRAFAACGSPAWPEVEAVLGRALSKDSQARFASVAAFARALADAPLPSDTPNCGRSSELRGLVSSVVASVRVGSQLALARRLPATPTASVSFGAAGIALGCLRMSFVDDDPSLFALAEFWSLRASREAADDAAFRCERLGIAAEAVGPVSPFHTVSGVHAVAFLIAAAGGDRAGAERALIAFLAACSVPCDGLDVMLGASGILLVAAIMLDALPPGLTASRRQLLEFGDAIARNVWERQAHFTEIGGAPEITALGTAHGWTGLLYAALSWASAAGRVLPTEVRDRLEQLAALREPWGSGARWPVECRADARARYASSWCNGSAGHIFTWTAAYMALGDSRFLERAEEAAWNVWESSRDTGNLCCGDAGAAYALLNLYRLSGDARWVQRSEQLAYRAFDAHDRIATEPALRRQSLFKGILGIAVLAADLAEPQRARLPFFERDADTCAPISPQRRERDAKEPSADSIGFGDRMT